MSAKSRAEPEDHDAFMDDQSNIKVIASFDDMQLHPLLLRGIYSYGFEKPSVTQQRAIAPFIKGGDIIVQAKSGTGKTGAFSIGLLSRLDFRLKRLQALVLSPTRELAMKAFEVISAFGEYLSGGHLFCHTFVGGTDIKDDINSIWPGIIVAVGTPGRVSNLISGGALRIDSLRCMVLDEADGMLAQSVSQICHILESTSFPKDTQVALFSATMPQAVLDVTTAHMRNPTRILQSESLTLEGVKQFYVAVEEDHKLDTLVDLFKSVTIAQSVIFANTRRKVDKIVDSLSEGDHNVSSMCADVTKSGSPRVLVTTILDAHGVDAHHINLLINYDFPITKEDYFRRIGRGKGAVINFVSQRDVELLREIAVHYHTLIDELPTGFVANLG